MGERYVGVGKVRSRSALRADARTLCPLAAPRPGSLVPRAPSSPRVARSAPRNPGPITRSLPDADHCARIRDASAAAEQGRAVGGSREERPDRWRWLKNTLQHA